MLASRNNRRLNVYGRGGVSSAFLFHFSPELQKSLAKYRCKLQYMRYRQTDDTSTQGSISRPSKNLNLMNKELTKLHNTIIWTILTNRCNRLNLIFCYRETVLFKDVHEWIGDSSSEQWRAFPDTSRSSRRWSSY